MHEHDNEAFVNNVRGLLREVLQIRYETGYSTDQVLAAMIAEAVRELKE